MVPQSFFHLKIYKKDNCVLFSLISLYKLPILFTAPV